MMATAIHNAYDTTPARVLFVALELSEKTGSAANVVQGAMQGRLPISMRPIWQRA
jgi:hypothetical protein